MTDLEDYIARAESAARQLRALRERYLRTEHPDDLTAVEAAERQTFDLVDLAAVAITLTERSEVVEVDTSNARERLKTLPGGAERLARHTADTDNAAGWVDTTALDAVPLAPFLLDWGEFWSDDQTDDDWLIEPLIARGRGHALYAGAKTGKSYFVLAACAALATGRPFLAKPAGEPAGVLYIDYEMTAPDLRDRLTEYGYGPDDDLSRLHYALLPTIAGLDTERGGSDLAASAVALGVSLVVIDTTSRAVEGEENDARTYQDLYRHTGIRLKEAGIAMLRIDHAGKNADRGQRGSSSKNDDVDVVMRLERRDNGLRLTATHRRMSWVPETTDVTLDEGPPITFRVAAESVPPGTQACIDELDRLGVPTSMGARKIRREYPQITVKNDVLRAAVAARRTRDPSPLIVVNGGAADGATTDAIHPHQPVDNHTKPVDNVEEGWF